MYISRHVDIPEKVLEAAGSGTLVVFAGAGVSVPQPSGLPTFKGLANEIATAARKALVDPNHEPLDRFLGRLDRESVPVHQRAASILSNPGSRPTSMHRDICGLFRSAQDLRLVTTNLDIHFTTAVTALSDQVEIFRAPAMPLGRSFSGLVYLHGCVDRPPERFVLTDQDFGRAYLTEGWATAFLVPMFQHYTVIFVGYSHQDPVMPYISRALPPGTARFALTSESPQDWEYYGIQPIVYPMSKDADRYSHLYDALDKWAALVQMGHLDHEARMTVILSGPPPSEPELASYIENSLRFPERASIFVRYAKGPEWLRWAEVQEAFRHLFDPRAIVGEVEALLASWFVSEYVVATPDDAMQVVQRQSQCLHPYLIGAILQRLCMTPQPASNIRSKWLALLLSETIPKGCQEWLNYLLADCAWPSDADSSLLLFDELTRPRLALDATFRRDVLGREALNFRPQVFGKPYYVRQAWNRVLSPALAECAVDVLLIATRHLSHTHRLLSMVGGASDNWDYFSWRRTAVEPHEQDDDADDALCMLVDAARDAIEHLSRTNENCAEVFLRLWDRTRTPILCRLAVHAVGLLSGWGPDEKIRWLVDNGYVYGRAKHEVFRLLESCYSDATEAGRLYLLDSADRGMDPSVWDTLPQETRDYERFNLLVWLAKVAPLCELTKIRLQTVRASHPEFEPRDRPDLDIHTVTGVVDASSRLSIGDILLRSPEDDFDWLSSYQDPSDFGPSREGFIENLSGAASQSFAWGLQLCLALNRRQNWTSDLWQGLLGGWGRGERSDSEWCVMLSHLQAIREPWHQIDHLVRMLEDSVTRSDSPMPQTRLDDAVVLGMELWKSCASRDSTDEVGPWLNRALAHWAGRLAIFMIKVLSTKWKHDAVTLTGMTSPVSDAFDLLASEPRYAGQMARVVLASQVHFLFATDRAWTEQNMLPRFDWSNEAAAEQAWHGYLVWGRWSNEALVQQLLPYYRQSITRLTTGLSEHRERFCRHLAYIAARPNAELLHENLLHDFVAKAHIDDRRSWAIEFRGALRTMPEAQKSSLWTTWLMRYWDQRLQGIPRLLDAEELGEMVGWAMHLAPVLDEAVTRVEKSQPIDFQDSLFLLMDLGKSDLPERHPMAVARLLEWILGGADRPFRGLGDAERIAKRLIEAGVADTTLRGICESLSRLGSPNARAILDLLTE